MLSEKRRRRNRDTLGKELMRFRQKEGFTQKAIAEALRIKHYTMISQMERGYMAIPSIFWVPIAETLHMDRHSWVLKCTEEYFPEVRRAMFGNRGRNEVSTTLSALHKGLLEEVLEDLT